jgi:predicted anti-sigma-YlaC factor YlaD
MEVEDTLSCAELVELVSDHLEGKLAPEPSARVALHLRECEACALYLDQMRETLRLAGTLRQEDVSEEALAALSHAFARWKHQP